MPAFPIASASPVTAPVMGAGKLWAYAIGGMVAGACAMAAVYVIATAPASLFLGIGGSPTTRTAAVAFDQPLLGRMQILRGVNGETVAAVKPANPDQAALPAGSTVAANEVSPVALDRLSAGDCIALTTASGQKLSFRIVGTHAKATSRDRTATATIDLDITACAPGSEAILKAVIESKADGRQSAVQRNL